MGNLSNVEKLLNSVASLYARQSESRADNAPNFNLFQILKVEGREVSTHSAFLAHLLTSTETHAQGDLFLRRFLLEVGLRRPASFNGWTTSKEVPFEGGRLDIVLQSASARAIIVIENKIDTQDHPAQLVAYRRWLDMPSRKKAFETRMLLYLTPGGELAQNAPRNIYEPISYSGHITRWLSSCKVKPTRVGETIKAYLLTISNLTTETLMRDDLDDKIIKVINTSAMRPAALRISRVGNLLKEQILTKIWDRGEAYLKKKLREERLTFWSLDRTDGSPLQTHYEIGMVAERAAKEKPCPRFSFFQYFTPTVFRWEIAVRFDGWRGNYKKIRALPEAKKLSDVMDGTFSMPKKRAWDGYLLVTDDEKGVERVLEDEIARPAGVSEFFEMGWEKFNGLEPHLRRLNEAVLRMY